MIRRTRCWRSDRGRVAIEELLRRWRAARRRSSSCRGCQAFVCEPLPPWPQLRLMLVSRERAGLNDGVPDSRAEHMARRSDQRGQGPRPGPVPRAPRGLLHPGALDGRGGRERVGRCEHRTPRPPSHAHSGPALSPHRSRLSCCRPPTSHPRRGLSAAPLHPPHRPAHAPTPHAPCSPARWTHELVSGSIGSYRRGSCGWTR